MTVMRALAIANEVDNVREHSRSSFDYKILMIANCKFFLELAIRRIAK